MKPVLAFFALLPLFSCGYNLRGDSRPFFDQHHIQSVYVKPVKNNSYKAGVEITVYNALRKRIAEGGYVRVVDQEGQADATFSAIVYTASYSPEAPTTANQLQSSVGGEGPGTVQIASLYNVSLKVAFVLRQVHPDKVLWSDELTRNKKFPATTYLGNLGSTSALINESDYERALVDLSQSIVTDAEESINSIN